MGCGVGNCGKGCGVQHDAHHTHHEHMSVTDHLEVCSSGNADDSPYKLCSAFCKEEHAANHCMRFCP